jgi:hypothetical protein
MKKLIAVTITAALAAILAGCQTRITAEKYAEVVTPIQKVVKVNGEDVVITANALVSSGGWYATARSPLWATEALSGLSLGVATNGTVYLNLDEYNRDLSTNAVVMVNTLSELAADIAGKVTAAICAYYGGGAVSATSKLGEMTIKDITGRVQAKLAKKGITDANCKDCDSAAIASEVCEDCCADCCADCTSTK